MKWDRTHQGKNRQSISQDEAEAQGKAGLTPGVTPDLHAPEIAEPMSEPEMNLHGDVDGSPYSANPGEISLAEAAEKDRVTASPATDDAATRDRELESRRTGTSTEQLAAEDEAEGDDGPPKRSRKK